MNGFKLIAIRPLKDCSPFYRKILKKGEMYQFYNDYEFKYDKDNKLEEDKDVIEIKDNSNETISIYNIKNAFGKPINISVSAIVGKNGSGKSTLPDLLLYSLFRILNYLGKIPKLIEQDSNLDINSFSYNKNFNDCIDKITNELKVEFYYQINETISVIRIIDNTILTKKFIRNQDKSFSISSDWQVITNNQLSFDNFFYTVLMNYSLHSFNSNEIGNWVDAFFHKNDGYQMPIVINPYREQGSIDINNERVLTRDRLLVNLLLIPNYRINKKSDISKIGLNYNGFKDVNQYSYSPQFVLKFREKILTDLFSEIFDNEFHYPTIDEKILENAEKYLIRKLMVIAARYKQFNKFDKRKDKEKEPQDNFEIDRMNEDEIKEFVTEIKKDRSHITYKVRRALNFLRENIYKKDNSSDNHYIEFDFNELKDRYNQLIERIKDKTWFTEPIDYLPPSFYFCKIVFEDKSTFEELSSGEKQQIQTLNSIIYHLRNLDSVHKKGEEVNNKNGIIAYKNINLILDEIELYYHPEYQRRTINDLLFFIKEAKFEFIENINISLITHSPFILSDIINTNLLGLKEENRLSIPIFADKKTFGANIHELLANDFFLKAFMGKFAEEKINSLVNFLKSDNFPETDEFNSFVWTEDIASQMISLIGEPILQERLYMLLDRKFSKDNDEIKIKNRIEQLQKELTKKQKEKQNEKDINR